MNVTSQNEYVFLLRSKDGSIKMRTDLLFKLFMEPSDCVVAKARVADAQRFKTEMERSLIPYWVHQSDGDNCFQMSDEELSRFIASEFGDRLTQVELGSGLSINPTPLPQRRHWRWQECLLISVYSCVGALGAFILIAPVLDAKLSSTCSITTPPPNLERSGE